MANNNSKKKTNTNNKKNNTKKVNTTKKVNETKNTNTTKKVEKVNNNKKEVKKVTPKKEEVKVEKITEVKETKKVKKEKKKFELTSKQRDIILVLLVAVVLIIAMVITGKKEPELNIELPIALEGTPGFTEITYSEYEEKLNTEAPFLVVIVQDGCGYCEQYEPVVDKVANDYALPIYYINLTNLTSTEQASLSKSNKYLKTEKWGTPTTLFMYGSTVVDSIGGAASEEQFVEFVKENFVVE